MWESHKLSFIQLTFVLSLFDSSILLHFHCKLDRIVSPRYCFRIELILFTISSSFYLFFSMFDAYFLQFCVIFAFNSITSIQLYVKFNATISGCSPFFPFALFFFVQFSFFSWFNCKHSVSINENESTAIRRPFYPSIKAQTNGSITSISLTSTVLLLCLDVCFEKQLKINLLSGHCVYYLLNCQLIAIVTRYFLKKDVICLFCGENIVSHLKNFESKIPRNQFNDLPFSHDYFCREQKQNPVLSLYCTN